MNAAQVTSFGNLFATLSILLNSWNFNKQSHKPVTVAIMQEHVSSSSFSQDHWILKGDWKTILDKISILPKIRFQSLPKPSCQSHWKENKSANKSSCVIERRKKIFSNKMHMHAHTYPYALTESCSHSSASEVRRCRLNSF